MRLTATTALLALAPGLVVAEPRGGYLDWVFYDDLPASERARISHQCPGSFIDPWTDPETGSDVLETDAERQSGRLNDSVRLEGGV